MLRGDGTRAIMRRIIELCGMSLEGAIAFEAHAVKIALFIETMGQYERVYK